MSSTTLRRLIVLALIVLWEVLPRIGAIPELFLPSLSSTLQAGWHEAGEYGHGAGKHATIDVLTEEDPGDRHRGEALGVEKKRTGATGCGRQSCHQQRRTENAAEKDDQAEPGEIARAQRRLRGLVKKPGTQSDDAEADPGTEIEQAREEQRVDYA